MLKINLPQISEVTSQSGLSIGKSKRRGDNLGRNRDFKKVSTRSRIKSTSSGYLSKQQPMPSVK